MLGVLGREQKLLWYYIFMDEGVERNEIDLVRERTFTSVGELTELINKNIKFYYSLRLDEDLEGQNLIGDENVDHLCRKHPSSNEEKADPETNTVDPEATKEKAQEDEDQTEDLYVTYQSPPIICERDG